MFLQLLISYILINIVIANDQYPYGEENEKTSAVANKNTQGFYKWKQHYWMPHKKDLRNATYIDKVENMIRLPTFNKFNNSANKKKFIKKSPKRTIQKIIKKNKQKAKKIYVMKMTSPTASPEDFEIGKEEMEQWQDDPTTVPSNQKKKSRKYSSKIARYPMPFQKLHKMRNHKRERRGAESREDFYILKNFNELKFIKNENDYNVVNAHIKKYW